MAFLLLPLLAQGIYAGVISTISTLTVGTAKLATNLYKNKNPDVANTIKRLDIEHKLSLIEAVIKSSMISTKSESQRIDLEKSTFEIINREFKSVDPIQICLHAINSVITDIHTDLNQLNQKIESHSQKWFSSWRSLNIKSKLVNLEINCGILDKRFDELIKVHQLVHSKII